MGSRVRIFPLEDRFDKGRGNRMRVASEAPEAELLLEETRDFGERAGVDGEWKLRRTDVTQ